MQSMEEIYKEHARTVYRYLLSLTHDESVAEELTQETFYQAVKSVHRFEGNVKVSTWLCGIAKNCLRSYQRKHPITYELEESDAWENAIDEALLASESRIELLKHFQKLSPEIREVMYLRIYGELSFREIGDVLSKSENWARVTFYRGKEKLRKEMLPDGT